MSDHHKVNGNREGSQETDAAHRRFLDKEEVRVNLTFQYLTLLINFIFRIALSNLLRFVPHKI